MAAFSHPSPRFGTGRSPRSCRTRQCVWIGLIWSICSTVVLLGAEDPPAAPGDSAVAPARQALLERRRELILATQQHFERQQLDETLQCLGQILELCRQLDPTGTELEQVDVLLKTYQDMCRILKIRRDYGELLRVSQEALTAQHAAREKGMSDQCDSAVFMVELANAQLETGADDNARATRLAAREELRSIEESGRTEGVYSLDVRLCLQLANAEFRQGHLKVADQHFSDAVEVARAASAKFASLDSRRQLATCLYSRARALRVGERSSRAAMLATEAYELSCINYFLTRLDADDASVLQSQVLLGAITRDIGDNQAAKVILELALNKAEISLDRLPSFRDQLEESAVLLLGIAIDRRDIAEQTYLRDRIIEMLTNRRGDVVPAALRFELNANRYLGRSYYMTGDLNSAEARLLGCLRKSEDDISDDRSFEIGIAQLLARNDLAAFYSSTGRLDVACRYLEDLLVDANRLFSRQEFPNGHVVFASISLNAGIIYRSMGETDKAAAQFEFAVESLTAICQQESQAIDPALFASAIVCWADILTREHRYTEAESQLASSVSHVAGLALSEECCGCDVLEDLLIERGRLKRAQGAYAEARDLFGQALQFATTQQDASGPNEQYGIALILAELGRTYAAERDFAKALDYHQQSLAIRQAVFPKSSFPSGHPSVANSLRDLGTAFLDGDDPERAFLLLKESVTMEHALGESFAGGNSEAQLLNLASRKFQSLGPLLEAWTRANRSAEDVYPHVWLRHGFVSRVTSDRQRELRDVAHETSPELYDQYLTARQNLARALLVSLSDDHERNRDRRELLQQLNATKESLERQLTRQFISQSDEQSASRDIQRLQDALPEAAVLVDFLACRRRPYDATVPDRADPKGDRRLFAFVVAKNRPVQCVELGDAHRIRDLARAWHSSLAMDAGWNLRKAIWDPVSKHFPPGTNTVYIVPDEDLATVAWAALPGEADGQFLLDHYAVALVPYGKFLLDQLRRRASGCGDHTPLLVVADVDYGGNTPTLADNRGGINNLLWAPLPASRTEADAISAHMPPGSVHWVTGAEATLPNILQHLPHVRTLHFATHGFYIDDSLISQLELLAAQGPASSLTINRSRSSVLARNPFLRSGLVLAGANQQVRLNAHGLPQLGDSILSAEAVMALNAEQVELVVLSACDSGMGDPISGDTSWGMQAAFHIAGARNVVGGLWKVSDQATATLMAEFYRHLGRKGTTPVEALRAAQLTLARHAARPSSDRGIDLVQTLPVSDTQTDSRAVVTSLRDWAGFVLSGPGF